MPINRLKKLLYIHIPKTAGTSITSYLFPEIDLKNNNSNVESLYGVSRIDGFPYQHIGIKDIVKYSERYRLSLENLKEYHVVYSIRHPIDRFISEYFYFCRTNGSQMSLNYYTKFLYNIYKDSNEYCHILTQSSFIYFQGKHISEYCKECDEFSFESLFFHNDIDFFKKRMNKYVKESSFPHLQKNERKKNQNIYKKLWNLIDKKYQTVIIDMYYEDFDNFNYMKGY